ncbi:hypothetical protein [Actinomadura flavalba]|uniref:hypothetical protein n=1 Tax=Actinomadura flavalba TaxID=1120938 RepID=UPI00037C7A0A|nr:hypothetical protein [Actinomadura flavalba]
MTVGTATDRVDQIVFAWSDRLLLGGSGLGPVATSLPSDDLRVWSGWLHGGDIAVGQWLDKAPECVAFGALRFGARGDHGAVLRLTPAQDANGRATQLVHALVGPSAAVSPQLALRLHDWPGWVTPQSLAGRGPELAGLHAGDLAARRPAPSAPVDTARLAGLLACVLANPNEAYAGEPGSVDGGLLEALIERVDGAAGDDPWTFLWGAGPTARETRVRLVVSDVRENRRGRTHLGAAGAAPEVERAAGLLAAMPAGSLTRPARPARDRSTLLAWIEHEHQRRFTMLAHLRQILDGTADAAAREYLDGAEGSARLERELAEVDTAELAALLARWRDVEPPRLERTRRALGRAAVLRNLTDFPWVQARIDADSDTLWLDVAPGEAERVIRTWHAGLAEITDAHRYGAVYTALRSRIDVTTDPTIAEIITTMPSAELLGWCALLAEHDDLAGALHFLHVAVRQATPGGDRDVRDHLAANHAFQPTIDRLARLPEADPPKDLYRYVLILGYGRVISDPVGVVSELGAGATAEPLWTALAELTAGPRERLALAAASAARHAPQGLTVALVRTVAPADLIIELDRGVHPPALLDFALRALHAYEPGTAAERGDLREILRGRGFLSSAVEASYPRIPDRMSAYEVLLRLAFAPGDRAADAAAGITETDARSILGGVPSASFVWAVLDLASADAMLHILCTDARLSMHDHGVSGPHADRVLRAPAVRTREPVVAAPTAPPVPPQNAIPPLLFNLPPENTRADAGGPEPGAGQDGEDSFEPVPRSGEPAQAPGWKARLPRPPEVRRSVLVLIIAVLTVLLLATTVRACQAPDDAEPGPAVTVTTTPTRPDRTPPGDTE